MTTTSTHTLAGFMQGRTWFGRADEAETFDGAVPREAAINLLSFPLAEGSVTVNVLTPDGVTSIEAADRKAIVRTDTGDIFGMFKKGYQIHRPDEWLIQNLELILDGGLEIGTVAMTRGGARTLLQAEMPEGRVATAPGAEPVPHRPHITAATSQDGTIATTYGVGTRVIVCENELSVRGARSLLSSFDSVRKVRHTSQSLNRVLEVRQSLGIVVEQVGDAFDEQFRKLASEYVSDTQWAAVVDAFTGRKTAKEGRSLTIAEKKGDALDKLWKDDERAAPWRNSAYGVLAAFNTAAHHILGADNRRTERNQERTINGEWDEFDSKILRLLATA